MLEVQVSSLDQIYNWLKRTFKLDIDSEYSTTQVGINIETLQTPENGYFWQVLRSCSLIIDCNIKH